MDNIVQPVTNMVNPITAAKALLLCLALSSCAQFQTEPATDTYRLDAEFHFTPLRHPSELDIFAISPAMEDYVEQRLDPIANARDRTSALAADLFNREYFAIDYHSQSDLTAAEAFATGMAHCLSLTIMAHTLANAAGIQSQFRRVNVDESWGLRDDDIVVNGHVNLRLFEERDLDSDRARGYHIIDFLDRAHRFNSEAIDRATVTALFYTNLGADALAKDNYNSAYRYFISAIESQPKEHTAWYNLGVLYRRTGYTNRAEIVYQYALILAPNNKNILESLAILYKHTGRNSKASALLKKVHDLRAKNPAYHLMLGDKASRQGEYASALKHYKQSYKLNNKQPKLLLSLAQAYYQLADYDKARRTLMRGSRYIKSKDHVQQLTRQLQRLAPHFEPSLANKS